MSYSRNTMTRATPYSLSEAPARWVGPARKPAPHPSLPNRTYEINWLANDGEICRRIISAPAHPLIEAAFTGFARGCLIHTPDGPVAVEDFRPGMNVDAVDGEAQTVRWVGAMTLEPSDTEEACPLYRVTDGGMAGFGGYPDAVFGPAAMTMRQSLAANPTACLTPISAQADGHSVVEMTPKSPVQVYHIVTTRHSLIQVNNLIAATFHPGARAQLAMDTDLFGEFLSLFPHIRGLADFGPPHARRT